MEQQNDMDDLCQQLAAFNISARLKRLTEDEQLLKEPKLQSGRSKNKTFQQTSSASLCRPGLPPPKLKASKRPCWEPPILDHSWLEILLNAQKEMTTRDGNEEISWRTDIIDNIIEGEILYTVYSPWVKKQAVRARHLQEMAFLKELEVALREVMRGVNEEGRVIRNAHGNSASNCGIEGPRGTYCNGNGVEIHGEMS